MQREADGLEVAIYMIAYNHEKYIVGAVESIMMQRASFRYKLFIGEDCSSDSTRSICIDLKSKYSDRIELSLNPRNLGAAQNARSIFGKCVASGAKYIALCEGDDYWTDPDKLKKQVEFMESNTRFAFVHSTVLGLDEKGTLKVIEDQKRWNNYYPVLDFRMAIFKPIAFTCSVLLRNRPELRGFNFPGIVTGDWALFVLLTLYGKAYCMREETSVYRMHVGISKGRNWSDSYLEQAKYLISMVKLLKWSPRKNTYLIRGALYFYAIHLHYNKCSASKIGRYLTYKMWRLLEFHLDQGGGMSISLAQ